MTYRFADFVVSPKRRLLLREGRELPLIPRYFDLLVLLLERRHEAVHRRDIFDRVWGDVIVSDTALNQAIRTIRRTLDDDPKEPRFIRTVARHGYRFVCADVVEVTDDEAVAEAGARAAIAATAQAAAIAEPAPVEDQYEPLLTRLTDAPDEEERRDAAERLHALGTADALTRLGTRDGHARARALLRDTRWDSPRASDVPVIGAPDPLGVTRALIGLRVRRAARLVASRWAGASLGGGLAGAIAGGVGGLLLAALPDSQAPAGVAPVLAAIGAGCGAAAGAGVGAGLSLAETTARSRRTIALVAGGALGGGAIGTAAQWISRWTLAGIVNLRVDIGGGLEGIVIGAAAGLGYALSTRAIGGGMAAPRGRRRAQTAGVTALMCGLAALAITSQGRPLIGGTVHAIARAGQDSGARPVALEPGNLHPPVSLAPLGRLVGEPDFGPVTQALIGFGEAAVFGLGLAFGLTRRPRN